MAFRGTIQNRARDLNFGEQLFALMLRKDLQGESGGFADALHGFGIGPGGAGVQEGQDFSALSAFNQSRQPGFTGPPSPFPQLQSPRFRNQFSNQVLQGLDPNQQSLIRQRESLINQRSNQPSQSDIDINNLLKFSEQKRRLVEAAEESLDPDQFKTEIDLINKQIAVIQRRTSGISKLQQGILPGQRGTNLGDIPFGKVKSLGDIPSGNFGDIEAVGKEITVEAITLFVETARKQLGANASDEQVAALAKKLAKNGGFNVQ